MQSSRTPAKTKIRLAKAGLFLNFAAVLAVIYLLLARGPAAWRNYEAEGKNGPDFTLTTIGRTKFSLHRQISPVALIFWASWCGPCKVELSRINSMVESGELKPDSILAISLGEATKLVEETARERGYRFAVAADPGRVVGNLYGVDSTPTIVLIDKDHRVSWLSSGFSPSLGVRLRRFFSREN